MVDAYERLSDESRYRRFLSPHKQLTDAELRYFTEVDHHDHEALVAGDPESGEWVGVARYVRKVGSGFASVGNRDLDDARRPQSLVAATLPTLAHQGFHF